MAPDMEKEVQVKAANKLFYNTVADVYEEVDGRRSDELCSWIYPVLEKLAQQTEGYSMLDLGCGTGFMLKHGQKYFRKTYGLDISHEILKTVNRAICPSICAETELLPFGDESFDLVSCFAALHHVYDHKPLLTEAFRVLRKGGILYTDHDMELHFMKNFRYPMKIYRFLNDAGKKYINAKPELSEEIYHLSEIHSEGIDSQKIYDQLDEIGFQNITVQHHWLGLNLGLNKFITMTRNDGQFSRGFAPLLRVIAYK